ncbi:regulator [Klebsiella pneumoniae]|nr:regulator [Klebsiella pneumoniae]
MGTLLDLLRKQREEMAQKRARNGLNTAKLGDGEQYVRIFPNKEDPEATFFQPFGMHYVKSVGEDGKAVTNAYFCESNTHGGPCVLCEMAMEGKARHKGNTAMETRINDMRSSQRYLVNGIISKHADFSDASKTEIIELPSTVFEDMIKLVEEDMSDDIGNPLDKEKGYGFLVKRTGSGRDTEYTVSPRRKERGPIAEKFLAGMHDLVAFVDQVDETKRLATIKSMSRLLGVPMAASSSMTLPATGTAGALPGFGSVTGHVTTPAETSVIDDEIARAAEAEFKASEAVSPAQPAEEAKGAETLSSATGETGQAEEASLDSLLNELNSLG